MDWNDFFKSVRDGSFQSVYLFTGPEELTKVEALKALRAALLPPGLEQLNDITLEGVGAQEIIDCCETLPVMCDRRIVVVRNWQPLLPAKNKKKESSDKDSKADSTDAESQRMLDWLKNPPDTCALVFYMSVEADGRRKLAATLKKMGCVVEFDHLSGAALQKWCAQQLKPLGKRITVNAINELSMMAGQDLNRLSGELKKLAAYIGERSEIHVEDVQEIVSPSPEYTVFMILDHLLSGKLSEATKVVNSVLQTEPSAVRLINLLASQLRIDTHMKYAMESGSPLPEVQKNLGISDGRAFHIKKQVRHLSADALRERYLSCVEANYAVTTGQLQERAALDKLLIKLVKS